MANQALSWIAVRQGAQYCAPACGHGCTYDEYLAAHKAADNCRAKLKMPQHWTVVVHENLGWHWKLVNGPIMLYGSPTGKSEYWAMVSSDIKDPAGGSGLWTERGAPTFSDPNKAVEAAVLPMCRVVAQLEKLRDHVLHRIPPIKKLGGCIVDTTSNTVLVGSALREMRDRLSTQLGVTIAVRQHVSPSGRPYLVIRAEHATPGHFVCDVLAEDDTHHHQGGSFDVMFDLLETIVTRSIVEATRCCTSRI